MKKNILKPIILLFFLTLVLPFLFMKGCFSDTADSKIIPTEDLLDKDVTIFRLEQNIVEVLSMDQYIKGVLAYYLNNDFNEETFKAMAVLIRTYAYYYSKDYSDIQKKEHPQYQLCDDDRCCLGYTDDIYMKINTSYETTVSNLDKAQFAAKLNKAVQETQNEVIVYNGEIILPMFFYASWGATENYSVLSGNTIKYLVSVKSIENAPEPYCESTKEYKIDDFILLMKTFYPDIVLTKNKLSEQIKIINNNDSGSVAGIAIGDKVFAGIEISERLELNSNCYNISVNASKVLIDVYGYGDGVGLSLYGADHMALAGSQYDKILKYYFYGTSVVHFYSKK